MTTRPLRVLNVVPDLHIGGAERHLTTLLPRLDRTRFAPSVVCIGEPGALFVELGPAGVPARALHRTKRQAVAALVDLVREMRRTRPDVVVVRGYNAEGLGRVAAALARVPRVVVWVHNYRDEEPRGRLRRVADRVLDRVTDAYFGVAHAQVEYLIRDLGHPPEKVQIIHNGVDVRRFVPVAGRDPVLAAELGVGPDDPVVGIFAALRPEKDHSSLLRAFRQVLDEEPEARLLIVGDGTQRAVLEKLAAELGVAGQVVFAGARPDVPALLGLVDVVVLSSYTECFPMAVLEAMACGVPVVCSAVGGIPEMVEDGVTGRLVPPRDPAALADGLRSLLHDRDRARRFGAAARAAVEARFGLAASVRGAEAALERTAGRTRSPHRPVRLTLVLDVADVGGAEVVLLDTLRHLDRDLVLPKVVCLREAGELAADFRAAGVDVEVLDRSGRYDLSTLPRLVRLLRSDRTDVVLVTHHHRAALAIGRLAARLGGAHSVVAVHDMDLTSVGHRCLPRSAVETLFFSDALLLLAPSQGDYLHREEGVGRFPWRRTREVVVPNGIRIPAVPDPATRHQVRTELGYQDADVVVGIVAQLRPQKAHEVLFNAMARLVTTLPELRLLVVGGGARETELRELADQLGIAERTRFTGIRRDVPRLLAGLDISCLSSVHEGVPLTVLESMAAGLPVVATDCGALCDVVDEGVTGHLVPVGDVSALAARLRELVRDPAQRRRMGGAGRARAERDFAIERTVDRLQQLLVPLIRKDRA
jgi:glycosyltransferase involved in cell wall biosynthesis